MQRVRGSTQKHNSASKRLHNLPAIAPRFWTVVALFSVIYIYIYMRFGNTEADPWRNSSGVLMMVRHSARTSKWGIQSANLRACVSGLRSLSCQRAVGKEEIRAYWSRQWKSSILMSIRSR